SVLLLLWSPELLASGPPGPGGVLAVQGPVSSGPGDGPGTGAVERARELAENGRQLFSEGSWDDAIEAFETAYGLVHDPNLLYNVSLAHERAGRFETAADALDRYRIVAPAAERETLAAKSAELRADAEADAEAAGQEVPTEAPTEFVGEAEVSPSPTNSEPDGASLNDEGREAEPASPRTMTPLTWTLVAVAGVGVGLGVGLGVGARRARQELDTMCVPQ